MFHVHVYHSAMHLFLAEMRVLFFAQGFFAVGAIVFGLVVFQRFRRRQRSVLWAGIHLAWVVLFWIFFLFMWYFWQIDQRFWRPSIAAWHYDLFLISLVLGVVVTTLGLILHHGKPRAGLTGRVSWLHLVLALTTVGLWGISCWPYR